MQMQFVLADVSSACAAAAPGVTPNLPHPNFIKLTFIWPTKMVSENSPSNTTWQVISVHHMVLTATHDRAKGTHKTASVQYASRKDNT